MAMTNYLFTSESITEGHPDKVADRMFGLPVQFQVFSKPEYSVK